MDQDNNVQAAVEAGKQIANVEARITEVDGLPVALFEDEGETSVKVLTEVLAERDKRAAAPLRLRGAATFQELRSFIEHVNRNKDPDSVIFADLGALKLTAVYNYHRARNDGPPRVAGDDNLARWADHRAVYACPLSPEWTAWAGLHEKGITQQQLAEFLDEHIIDVIGEEGNENAPAPAKLLEAVRELSLHSSAKFHSAMNLDTGEVQFKYEEEHKGAGQMKLPRAFVIGIPVFKAGDKYRVEVKLRYRLKDAGITFWLALQLLDKVKEKAFEEVRDKAQNGYDLLDKDGKVTGRVAGTGLPIYAGTPES